MKTERLEYRESKTRSVLKGLTWRVVATLTTLTISYALTRDIDTSLWIAGIEFVVKFLIYYLHERAWQMVPRGMIRQLAEHKS